MPAFAFSDTVTRHGKLASQRNRKNRTAARLASPHAPRPPKPVKHYGVGNVTARCGDGCLDRLVVSVRKSPGRPMSVVAGTAVLSATRSAPPTASSTSKLPLLLLGLMSGSLPRREALRCTWMRVPAVTNSIRTLFVVGKASDGSRPADAQQPDVLAIDVQEGAFMRSKQDEARNQSRTFDPKKLVRTGSITTYWKIVEWLKYAARQPERMIGCATGVSHPWLGPQSDSTTSKRLSHHHRLPPHACSSRRRLHPHCTPCIAHRPHHRIRPLSILVPLNR